MGNKTMNVEVLKKNLEKMKKSNSPVFRRMASVIEKRMNKFNNLNK